MPGGGPVAMTVEQRADYPAAQHAFKRLVLLAGVPLGDDFIAFRKAAHVQALRICRSTTKAREIRRVSFLNTFHVFMRNCWRNLKRWILPVAVYGSSGTKRYFRGCL